MGHESTETSLHAPRCTCSQRPVQPGLNPHPHLHSCPHDTSWIFPSGFGSVFTIHHAFSVMQISSCILYTELYPNQHPLSRIKVRLYSHVQVYSMGMDASNLYVALDQSLNHFGFGQRRGEEKGTRSTWSEPPARNNSRNNNWKRNTNSRWQ